MKIQDSGQRKPQIQSEIIDSSEIKQEFEGDKIPNQKKFKKRINLIKKINKQQLQQVLEVYKPSDLYQVAKKNVKDQNQSQLNTKIENILDQQNCREQESMVKPADMAKLEKSVKDTKYLTAINYANNLNRKIYNQAHELKQNTQENQTSKAIQVKTTINQQRVGNFKDEELNQKQLSSCNSKITGSSNLSLDLSLDNFQKDEQKTQINCYQKLNEDLNQQQDIQGDIIINFQEQYSSSFLSECQSQISNKQAQNNDYQLEQLLHSNKCSNSKLLATKNDQQINNQFAKRSSFQSTLDASGQIENHKNKKSQIKSENQNNEDLQKQNTNKTDVQIEEKIFLFEDIKQQIVSQLKDPIINGFVNNQQQQNIDEVKKQKDNSAHISQYIQKMKHRKIFCDNTKLNFQDNLNRAENLNQDILKNDQSLLENEYIIKTTQCKSSINSQSNRKRVLSQQIYNQNEQSLQILNFSQQKQDQTYQQKNLTPISCSQGKQNEEFHQKDRIKNTNFQFIAKKNESQEKTPILNYNFIVKQKQNSIQNTNIIKNQKIDFKYDQNKILEIKLGQNTPIEQRTIHYQNMINCQSQTAKSEKTDNDFNQVKQQKQQLNALYESNQNQEKKIDLLEQINNIYDTPSSVKNILQNIKSRSNSLSNNFKSSQNKKKQQIDSTKNNEQQQKAQQGQNLKANSTKNSQQNKINNNEKIGENDKQKNVKIRSNTLVLSNSPNSNNSNEISNSNISGNKTAENKRIENQNYRKRSNTNIQKSSNLTLALNQKQSKDLNQRYTNLFNQLNLDWKIQNIKNFIEQCHPEKIMQRSSFMKQQQKKSKQVRFLEDIDLDIS
ncbi:hypothetical protein ABPG74_004135 [Tetrahymena malaccensis]